MRVVDLARAIAPEAKLEITGIRPGEKLHEEMISLDDARRTLAGDGFYVIQPDADWWLQSGRTAGWANALPVAEGFRYTSDTNTKWLTIEQLRAMADA
jgi:UDP-N-acetylglucosamine 4,6-dehydratase